MPYSYPHTFSAVVFLCETKMIISETDVKKILPACTKVIHIALNNINTCVALT